MSRNGKNRDFRPLKETMNPNRDARVEMIDICDQTVPLLPGEKVLVRLETDLDERLHFVSGEVVLTSERLLSASAGGPVNPALPAVQTWPLTPSLTLSHSDHAGVGSLFIMEGGAVQASFRFTLGHNLQAIKLHKIFDALQNNTPYEAEAPEEDDGELGEHEVAVSHGSPTASLFRLWRFAQPYRGQLFLGFFLTIASTAASMVPPYLTMPLMDEVLIPFQNGTPIDFAEAAYYLSGLLIAALLAWGLGWTKTYILALVSERIGADLRTSTYEHLLKLSLQYFGGKRTGDLMARIGNETDRICVFLSLHLLDFATDVLMISMTAAILISINPTLAMVTLVPLPFIAWLIHSVRDRLRHGFEN